MVARILRAARGALAADHRHAVRSAGAEESDLQTLSGLDDAGLVLLCLDEAHPQFVQQVIHELRFSVAEIALRFLLHESDELDHLRGTGQVRFQLFAGGGIGNIAKVNGSGGRQRQDEAGKGDALVFLILHVEMLA